MRIDVPITDKHHEIARDILCTILESNSSGYWARFRDVKRDSAGNYLSVKVADAENLSEQKITGLDLIHAAALVLRRKSMRNHYIIAACVSILFNPEDTDFDTTVADVLLQVAAYKDVPFG